MGIITCYGRLALMPGTVHNGIAAAKGKISDRDPPRQKPSSSHQFLLSIYYPKYHALQRQYLAQGHPEALRQPLRSFGMTDEGIAYLEATAQVRSTVHHGCPSRFRVIEVAERGAEVVQGDLLFRYGEVAMYTHLPKRVVEHLEAGTEAHAYPQNWPETSTPGGRRLSVRVAHVDSGSWSDHAVYLSVKGTCPDYKIGASFNLNFDIPALPDGPAIIHELKLADKSIRPPTWLPQRGAAGGYLSRHKLGLLGWEPEADKASNVRHAFSTRVQPNSMPSLIQNGGHKTAIAQGQPFVATATPGSNGGSLAGNVAASAPAESDDGRPRSRRKSRGVATKPHP